MQTDRAGPPAVVSCMITGHEVMNDRLLEESPVFERTIRPRPPPNLTSSFAAMMITTASRGRHLTRHVNVSHDKMISQ